MVSEVIRQLKTEEIIFERNEIHVDLRNLVLLKQIVFKQKLITFDSPSWDEQNVDLFVISFFPMLFLIDDLVDSVYIRSYHENDGLKLWLHHGLVSQNSLFFDVRGVR